MKSVRNIFCAVAAGAMLLTSAAVAAPPEGYYNSLEGLTGVALKNAVKRIVRNHTVISYGDDTWDAFEETDTRYVNGRLIWWDMYSNNQVSVSSGHGTLNIEHSVANSWWGGAKNDAYKDIVHLNPSNADANNRKSNYPLGEIATVTWDNGVTFVGKPKSGTCGGASYVYEPIEEYKGDFARVFMYMFTVYDDIAWKSDWNWMYDTSSDLLLKPWAYELLIKWSNLDKVSEKEINRNNAIYKIQKNRNPFIDIPELADYIWGSKKGQPFHYNGVYVPGDDDDDPDPDVPDTPVTPDNPSEIPAGYWYAVTSTSQLNSTDRYVLVSVSNNKVMSATNAGKYMQICGSEASFDNSSSQKRLKSIPEDAGVIKLVPVSGGYALQISDVKGDVKGYLSSTTKKELTYQASQTASGCAATITPRSGSTTISYGSSVGNLLYNASAPRFLTYTSAQEEVMLYRLEEEKQSAGFATIEEDAAPSVLIGIYDINGRLVSTTGTDHLQPGIYIVVTSTGVRKILK